MASIADWRRPTRVAVTDVASLFAAAPTAADAWAQLGFRQRPDECEAVRESQELHHALAQAGVEVIEVPGSGDLSLDAVYAHDSLALTPNGLVRCSMAKPNRRTEPGRFAEALAARGVPVFGQIDPGGTLEGGDVVWLTDSVCAIGLSHRTNRKGADSFRTFCPSYVEIIHVALPYKDGPGGVFHLSTAMSVIESDVVLADLRYLPIEFLDDLQRRNFAIIAAPEVERPTMAASVLSLGNKSVLLFDSNPLTRAALAAKGFRVRPIRGEHLGIFGDGGPTCLVRPLEYSNA